VPQLKLASLRLPTGTYRLSVHGILNTPTGTIRSNDTIALITVVAPSLAGFKVYPNPWRADRDAGFDIRFENLSPGTTIKIFDLAGRWVKTLQPSTNLVLWDRRNDSGDAVASGLYLYLVEDNRGGKVRGKLTIIK
jgi:hypothetical protein